MRRLLILLLLLPITLACLPAASSTPPILATPDGSTPTQPTPYLQALKTYHATFELRFEGDYTWVYHLESRTDGSATAHNLHIEGVQAPQNPGDVRVVIEGDVTRMRGPGTGDACVQFPSDLDLGQSFLTPDDLIPPQELEGALSPLGTKTIAGREATHYTLRQANLAGWQDVEVDVWKDATTGAVLRYDLAVTGSDPLFDAGEGVLSGRFIVNDTGPQSIKPITGCEVDLPLPPDAARLVKIPSLVAFESAASAKEIAAFYQIALPEAGWEPLTEPGTGADAPLPIYHRAGERLDIHIETQETGVYVELVLSKE